MKLTTKILFFVSTLIILLVVLTTSFFIHRFNSGLLESLHTRGIEFSQILAEDLSLPILVQDRMSIDETVTKRVSKQGVLYIEVKNDEGETLSLVKNHYSSSTPQKRFTVPVMWMEGSGSFDGNELALFEEPEEAGKLLQIGVLEVGFSLETILKKQKKVIKSTTILAVGIILISLAVTYILVQKILFPIGFIASASEKISLGNYTERVHLDVGRDEIGIMVKAFNTMAETIQDYTEGLERKVESRTIELQEIHKELETKAYQAGMAEIARGVLHDVNNAMQGLKSNLANLNLSVENIDPDSFDKVLGYLKGVAHYDKKWSDVLSFFEEANQFFSRSRNEAIVSLGESEKTVNHITEIIMAQQKHAKATSSTKSLMDVNNVLVSTLNIYRQSIEKRGINLELRLSDKLPKLFLNEAELERFFGNFIRNSIDALDENSGEEAKFSIDSSSAGDRIMVVFSDTGSGIDAKDIQNIFRPDFTTKEAGTGFGLSFCLDFMKRNDGEIHVESVLGQGTVFTLTFLIARKSA